MSIELPVSVGEQLRNLAAKQGRDVRTLVEESVRQYLEAVAITDLDATQVAETQTALLGELPRVPPGRPTTPSSDCAIGEWPEAPAKPSRARLPPSRVPPSVHAGHNDDLVIDNAVVKGVWEATKICATSQAMNNRIL